MGIRAVGTTRTGTTSPLVSASPTSRAARILGCHHADHLCRWRTDAVYSPGEHFRYRAGTANRELARHADAARPGCPWRPALGPCRLYAAMELQRATGTAGPGAGRSW